MQESTKHRNRLSTEIHKVQKSMNKGTKACLEPVCIMMNQEPSEANMKENLLKNVNNTNKFVKEFDPEDIDGEKMFFIKQCTSSEDYTVQNIKNSNSELVPIRNWVVAAERYGMTFDKNAPIDPPQLENPEPVRTPQRKVKVTPKRQH